MILIDTSLWIDHLHHRDVRLEALLLNGQVLVHNAVIGELALGKLRQRHLILRYLKDLPYAIAASDEEIFDFIEKESLAGFGIGYVDAHLLASVRLTSAQLWTRDKRLHEAATRLKLAYTA